MAAPEILKVSPEEAVRDFRAKGLHAGFHWRDTDAEQHLISFTAAKAARLDVLEALREGVDSAIADGTTLETFRTTLEPKLLAMGWWGQQPMVDPVTGETSIVQLGSPHRLRTIFDTNIRMAYARGRWERIVRMAEVRPYLRYVAVLDQKTRPEHMAWHGTVLPWDHPFWRTHYPPCGWYCRCTVLQLSAEDLEEFGFKISDAPPEGWDATRPWRDRRNDRTIQVPVGIDPGFEHNAGLINLAKDSSDRLIEKIDAAPDLARHAIGRPWQTALFKRHLTGATDGDWPVAVVPPAALKAIGGRSGTVRLSGSTAAKQADRYPDIDAADYALVQRVLNEGEIFRASPRVMTGFLQVDGSLWRVVIKATGDGSETYLQTMRRAQQRDLAAASRRYSKIDR